MKRYTLSFAESIKHVPEHPDRTARRSGHGLDMDVYFQVWPSRAAMLTTIRMQEKAPPHPHHWRPVVRA